MTELQSRLLEMMKWLHNFISSHGMKYYVCCGTMIGAARHHGFIPWDDDIDIMMPREDYERLCSMLKKPISHYVIESPGDSNKDFLYTYAKFYDINTTMDEMLRTTIRRGVYIDIFPLDGLGNTMREARRYYRRIDRKNMFLATRVCSIRKERKWYKNAAIVLCRLIPRFFVNEHKLCLSIDILNKKRKYDDYQYVGQNMCTYRYRAIYNKDIFGNPTEFQFEDAVFWGPEKYEEYLAQTYGNWRNLPPEDKRYSPHDFTNVDFNHSYLSR